VATSPAVPAPRSSNAPDGFTTTIWDGITAVASDRREQDLTVTAPAGPAVYWVEIRAAAPLSSVPWITSNAIYVRAADTPTVVPPRPPARTSRPLFDGRSMAAWRAVSDPTSLSALDLATAVNGETSLRLRFGLSDGAPASQFAALAVQTPQGVAPGDRLSFSARAERPMRVSVQLQTETARWQRSIYVDTFSQPHTIFFDEFTPVGETGSYRAPAGDVRNVLFVVDTTNTKPGASGRLWIASPAIEQ